VQTLLSIGDFSRMTHLSVKALRLYHDLGLLEPAEVDANNGYRRYDTSQVPTAQVIRRFRDLGMPIEQVKAVLVAPDVAARNELIVGHLKRLESQLQHTQTNVSELRTLLEPAAAGIAIEHRSLARMLVASITETVRTDDLDRWWTTAFAELYASLRAANVRPAGPSGGLWPTELFADEAGESTVFVPIAEAFEPAGGVRARELPAVELAVALHRGPLRGADITYAALGTHVAERAIGVEGPIRESYLVTSDDTTDESQLRTEIGWPIFRTATRTY
jgi:DNA-binding transcriptional MerR regulator